MPFTISANKEKGWVEVIHRGLLNIAELNEARVQAAALLAKNSITRILVDTRQADMSELSLTDTFKFTTSHQEAFGSVEGLRIASVVRPEDLEASRFSETVARNRGTDARVFLDAAEAMKWLAE